MFYGAMEQVAKKSSDDRSKVFKKAVENVKPVLEVKTRRVGGANYQVPVEVNPFRRQSLAIRWLLQYRAHAPGRTMVDKLADELIDAANGRGGAMKEGRRSPHGGSRTRPSHTIVGRTGCRFNVTEAVEHDQGRRGLFKGT